MKYFVPSSFSFGTINSSGMATRSYIYSSPSVIRQDNSCLILNKKYVVPRPMKPRIIKLPFRSGKGNLSFVFNVWQLRRNRQFSCLSGRTTKFWRYFPKLEQQFCDGCVHLPEEETFVNQEFYDIEIFLDGCFFIDTSI